MMTAVHRYRRARVAGAALWLALGLVTPCSLAAAIASVAPLAPSDAHAGFLVARQTFEAGRRGAAGAVLLAQEQFRGLLSLEPLNPLYLAYLGSTYTLQARDSSLPWTRIRLVNQGLGFLDRALAIQRAGDAQAGAEMRNAQLETRLVAVATFVALPDTLFHRLAAAKRTFQEAINTPGFAHSEANLRGHLYYEGALIARQEHDIAAERSALKMALATSAADFSADEARRRLAQLP